MLLCGICIKKSRIYCFEYVIDNLSSPKMYLMNYFNIIYLFQIFYRLVIIRKKYGLKILLVETSILPSNISSKLLFCKNLTK